MLQENRYLTDKLVRRRKAGIYNERCALQASIYVTGRQVPYRKTDT